MALIALALLLAAGPPPDGPAVPRPSGPAPQADIPAALDGLATDLAREEDRTAPPDDHERARRLHSLLQQARAEGP